MSESALQLLFTDVDVEFLEPCSFFEFLSEADFKQLICPFFSLFTDTF